MIATLAGARGAITLAAILSLPAMLQDGTALAGRDLAIGLAAGVVLLTLLLAATCLPPILGKLMLPGHGDHDGAGERAARLAMAKAAEQHLLDLETYETDVGALWAIAQLRQLYRQRASHLDDPGSELVMVASSVWADAALGALSKERDVAVDLRRRQQVSHAVANRLLADVDLRTEQTRSNLRIT